MKHHREVAILDFTLHSRNQERPLRQQLVSPKRKLKHEEQTNVGCGGLPSAPYMPCPLSPSQEPLHREKKALTPQTIGDTAVPTDKLSKELLLPDHGAPPPVLAEGEDDEDRRTRRRRVGFDDRVHVLEIPARSSMLMERDNTASWYTSNENEDDEDSAGAGDDGCDVVALARTQGRNRNSESPTKESTSSSAIRAEYDEAAILLLDRDPLLSSTSTSTHQNAARTEEEDVLFTPMECKTSKRIITEAINEVLREQKLQWENKVMDPDQLADIYFEISWQNQRQALERGRRLAREIKRENCPTPEGGGKDKNCSIKAGKKLSPHFSTSSDSCCSTPRTAASSISNKTTKSSAGVVDSKCVDFATARSVFAARPSCPSFLAASIDTSSSVESFIKRSSSTMEKNMIDGADETTRRKENKRNIIQEVIEIVNSPSDSACGSDDEDSEGTSCSLSLEPLLVVGGNDESSTDNPKWDSSSSICDSAPCVPLRGAGCGDTSPSPLSPCEESSTATMKKKCC